MPILRAGNTLGVLVVQNRTRRVYAEEEIEALQTTAMVLAEMIASGELQAPSAPGAAEMALRRPLRCHGAALAEGVGLGHVVLHEPRVIVKNLIAENLEAEVERLEQAIAEVRASIDESDRARRRGPSRRASRGPRDLSACSPTIRDGSGACGRPCSPA